MKLWQKVTVSKLAGAFIALNIADGAMTKALMQYGGVEISPIWNFFLAHTNVTEFVLFKLIGALAISLVLLYFSFLYPNHVRRILACLVAGMVVVFTINAINLSAFFVGLG